MASTKHILLGKITKVLGYEGVVCVKLENQFFDNIPDTESVFLEIDGILVPFFISRHEYSGGNILRLIFEDYDSVDKISEFTGCRVFLTSVGENKTVPDEMENISGFKVISDDNTVVGVISKVIRNPGQLLLAVISPEEKEILIPFHEHLISGFYKEEKVLVMKIPEGLTRIN